MKIAITGGAGFLGTNLAITLSKDLNNQILIIDKNESFFSGLKKLELPNTKYLEASYDINSDFDSQINGQDIIFHLASTNIPGTSNQTIPKELEANVITTGKLLDACVRQKIKKIVFISSGGAVYGKNNNCPIKEDNVTYPITSYGIQKLSIEKLLYLYFYQFNLDYRIIRLANPYGPYQRPNGELGVVTTFVYKALKGECLDVYGDGTVIRDFIYVDDAIDGILKIANEQTDYRLYNLGTGYGTSVNQVINTIKRMIRNNLVVNYKPVNRPTDVPVNYLDISRFEKCFGKFNPISLSSGIEKTADYLRKNYNII